MLCNNQQQLASLGVCGARKSLVETRDGIVLAVDDVVSLLEIEQDLCRLVRVLCAKRVCDRKVVNQSGHMYAQLTKAKQSKAERERGKRDGRRSYVFLDAVAAVGQDDDAELALHLADHQLRVQPVGAGQDQHLCRGAAQKLAVAAALC